MAGGRPHHSAETPPMKKPAARAAGPEKWQIEEAMHTMRRAHEIRNDPKLHEAVKSAAAKHAESLKKVAKGAKL
jgi:hypothetical protein